MRWRDKTSSTEIRQPLTFNIQSNPQKGCFNWFIRRKKMRKVYSEVWAELLMMTYCLYYHYLHLTSHKAYITLIANLQYWQVWEWMALNTGLRSPTRVQFKTEDLNNNTVRSVREPGEDNINWWRENFLIFLCSGSTNPWSGSSLITTRVMKR